MIKFDYMMVRFYQLVTCIYILFYPTCGLTRYTNSNGKPSAATRLLTLYSPPDNQPTSSSSRKKNAIVLPGVHDSLSTKIFVKCGAQALFLSGFGVSACKLGQPDVGLLTLTEMENTLKSVVQAAGDVPVIVDGDTGYGGVINIRRTIRNFANMGAAAVTIEDQVFPKKCTYAAGEGGVRVVSRRDSINRIKAALTARDEARTVDGNDILVIARTDCRAALGFEEALERCKIFEELGADICYAENLQSKQEYETLRSHLSMTTGTILAQVQTGAKGQNLYDTQAVGIMGYDFTLLGVTALQAYIQSLEKTAVALLSGDGIIDDTGASSSFLMSFENLKSNIGFQDNELFQATHDVSEKDGQIET